MPRGFRRVRQPWIDHGRYMSGHALAIAKASSGIHPELKFYNGNSGGWVNIPSTVGAGNFVYPMDAIVDGTNHYMRIGLQVHVAKIWFRFRFKAGTDANNTIRVVILSSPSNITVDPCSGQLTSFVEEPLRKVQDDEIIEVGTTAQLVPSNSKYTRSRVFSLRKKNFIVKYKATNDAGDIGSVYQNAISVFLKHDDTDTGSGNVNAPKFMLSYRIIYYDN